MAKEKFPRVIYVKREKDGDTSYLAADDSAAGHAEVNQEVEIAIYNLSRVTVVKANAEVE